MEYENICPYKKEYTKKTKILGNDFLRCSIGECPYGNLREITLGDRGIFTEEICETEGLVKKIKEFA